MSSGHNRYCPSVEREGLECTCGAVATYGQQVLGEVARAYARGVFAALHRGGLVGSRPSWRVDRVGERLHEWLERSYRWLLGWVDRLEYGGCEREELDALDELVRVNERSAYQRGLDDGKALAAGLAERGHTLPRWEEEA